MDNVTDQSTPNERRNFLLKRLDELGAKLDVAHGTWRVGLTRHWTPEQAADAAWAGWTSLPYKAFVIEAREVVRLAQEKECEVIRARLLDASADRHAAARELTAFVKLLSKEDSCDDRLLYYETALRQIIWQVKRKLRGLPTWWDIMLVLVGPQGTGKSTIVSKFCEALGMLYLADADMSLFADKFRIQTLANYFLVRLDEMENGKNVQVQTLKRIVTAQVVTARGMRSESERTLKRNATFIGTSNRSVIEDVPDSTGNRRFIELQCRAAKYEETWGAQVRSINWTLVWQCEDGSDEISPIAHQQELVTRMQESERVLDDWSAWADECVVDEPGARTENKGMYMSYTQWMGEQARRPMSKVAFAKKCKERWDFVCPGNRITYCEVGLASASAG